MGSGTTAVACKELGRNFIGYEINKEYYTIAVDRLNGIKKEWTNEFIRYRLRLALLKIKRKGK